jgi:hypothetical protein
LFLVAILNFALGIVHNDGFRVLESSEAGRDIAL